MFRKERTLFTLSNTLLNLQRDLFSFFFPLSLLFLFLPVSIHHNICARCCQLTSHLKIVNSLQLQLKLNVGKKWQELMIMKHPLTTSVNLLQAWLYYIVLHSITPFIIKFLSLKLVCFLTWPFGETLLFFCSKRFRFLHHCLNRRFVQWNCWSFQHNQNSYSIKTTENANETFAVSPWIRSCLHNYL